MSTMWVSSAIKMIRSNFEGIYHLIAALSSFVVQVGSFKMFQTKGQQDENMPKNIRHC